MSNINFVSEKALQAINFFSYDTDNVEFKNETYYLILLSFDNQKRNNCTTISTDTFKIYIKTKLVGCLDKLNQSAINFG